MVTGASSGLGWALDNVVQRDDWSGVTTNDTVQAGTNALLLAALVERRLATGEASDALMVARGDLGLECSLAQLPALQKQIIEGVVLTGVKG